MEPKEESKSIVALRAQEKRIKQNFINEDVRHSARKVELGVQLAEVGKSIAMILKAELALYE